MVYPQEISGLDPNLTLKVPDEPIDLWDDAACEKALLREVKTGNPPKKPPRGYDKYKKYMGRIVRHELAIEQKSKQGRRVVIFERACLVIAALGGVAAIVELVLRLLAP